LPDGEDQIGDIDRILSGRRARCSKKEQN
jgi:hypothetical protein